MSLLHIPQSVVNGHISMVRNMFLTSSIAIAIIALSTNSRYFKNYEFYVKIFAYCIFLYSILYGLITAYMFNIYLAHIQSSKKLSDHDLVLLDQWRHYDILIYIYCAILVIFNILMIKHDFFSK